MNRISKEHYYLNIAQTVLERATCLRRVYGAIIVKNDEIISTGYNGSPRGRKNCVDMGFCTREAMQVPRCERYELCRSVHAEANAIISASRRDMVGGTLYLVGRNAQTGELLTDATSCPQRRAVARCDELPHVPPHGHQCGAGPCGDPPDAGGVHRGGRGGMGPHRRSGSSGKNMTPAGGERCFPPVSFSPSFLFSRHVLYWGAISPESEETP